MRHLLPSSRSWEYTMQDTEGAKLIAPGREGTVMTKRSRFRRSTGAIRIFAHCGFIPLTLELGETQRMTVKPITIGCKTGSVGQKAVSRTSLRIVWES